MKAFPIIYVRGYPGTQSEVEETVDDPFYGFNKGSTHVRVGPRPGLPPRDVIEICPSRDAAGN